MAGTGKAQLIMAGADRAQLKIAGTGRAQLIMAQGTAYNGRGRLGTA